MRTTDSDAPSLYPTQGILIEWSADLCCDVFNSAAAAWRQTGKLDQLKSFMELGDHCQERTPTPHHSYTTPSHAACTPSMSNLRTYTLRVVFDRAQLEKLRGVRLVIVQMLVITECFIV